MKEKSIFEYPALIGYLVKRLLEKHPNKQVGKTLVQKMMYLLSREGIVDFDYSMYHYGPYSSEVAGELDFAESADIVDVTWKEKKGYFIERGSNASTFDQLPNKKKKQALDRLVGKYGRFSAIELSIITTAYFLRDNFGVPEHRLAKVVHDVKPNHRFEFIEEKLRDAGVIKN